METNYTSTTIDTLCVISNENYNVLNVNDCPYSVAKYAIKVEDPNYSKSWLDGEGYKDALGE